MGLLSLAAMSSSMAAIMLIAGTVSPRMYALSVDSNLYTDGANANNATLNRFSERRLMLYGIYTIEQCDGDTCATKRETCRSLTGTACEDATAHVCKTLKAFSIIAVLSGVVAALAVNAAVWEDRLGKSGVLMEATFKQVGGFSALISAFCSMLVFIVFVRKVDGEVGTSWDCGFDEDGGYGISFLFFVLASGLNGTSAAALLVLPNSLTTDWPRSESASPTALRPSVDGLTPDDTKSKARAPWQTGSNKGARASIGADGNGGGRDPNPSPSVTVTNNTLPRNQNKRIKVLPATVAQKPTVSPVREYPTPKKFVDRNMSPAVNQVGPIPQPHLFDSHR